MARIRTIKPETFRHEGLQDLEAGNPGACCMLVFIGLWGHCDKAGRFEWRPRQLKLDILPFLDFDMAKTLDLLEGAGQVRSYEVDGKRYGVIESFPDHQRISGKESQEPEKHPEPPGEKKGSNMEATGKQQGSTGDQQESQEGKGREEEGNGGRGTTSPLSPVGDPLRCPTEELLALYHETMSANPRCKVLNPARRSAIRARWLEAARLDCQPFGYSTREDGLLAWRQFFEVCNESPFLTGRAKPMPGKPPFLADVDFLFSPGGFAKCIENKYHREAA